MIAMIRRTVVLLIALLLATPALGRPFFGPGTRYLDEETSTVDPLRNPTAGHPWLYANGNPMRYVDPDGRYGRDGIYGCGNPNNSSAIKAACAQGGGPAAMESAAYRDARVECGSGSGASCFAFGPAAVSTAVSCWLTGTCPLLLRAAGTATVAVSAASVLTLKHDEPGGAILPDPIGDAVSATFGAAYQCGDDISLGKPATMSCGLTALNLATLGYAARQQRLLSVAEPAWARFLPQAQRRVQASAAEYGNVEAFAMARLGGPAATGGAATFSDPAERALASHLEGLGRKVSKNPLEGAVGAGRQGDAYVDGVLHEFKRLDPGARPGTVKNVVNDSIRGEGQAREIIIDARGSGLSEAAAQTGAGKALGISRGKVDGLTILGDDYFFRWTPRQ